MGVSKHTSSTASLKGKHTVIIADACVEVNLRVVPFAVSGAETSPENVAVVDADVLGAVVESHFE